VGRKTALRSAGVVQHGVRLGQEIAQPVWCGRLPLFFRLQKLNGLPLP